MSTVICMMAYVGAHIQAGMSMVAFLFFLGIYSMLLKMHLRILFTRLSEGSMNQKDEEPLLWVECLCDLQIHRGEP